MRRLYFSLGKNKFWEYVLLALFLLFFYGPLMNMLLLSFAGDYEYPDVIPRSYGFKWWDYVLSKALAGRMPARRLRAGTLPVQGPQRRAPELSSYQRIPQNGHLHSHGRHLL